MLPKQALKACLAGEPTPVVPAWRFWTDGQFRRRYPDDIVAMNEKWDDDFALVEIFPKKREMDWGIELAENEHFDGWHCLFGESPDGVGWHPTRPIINNLDDWARYLEEGLPIVDEDFAAPCRKAAAENPDGYITGTAWRTYFERMFMLMGFEPLMMEIATDGELFRTMRKDLFDLTIRCIHAVADSGADAVYLADDWGTQHRLMISPAHFAQHFKPDYAAMIETAHARGLDVWMHSCGQITEAIPHWIDINLDVISNLQTLALDLPAIAEAYRGQITFLGGLDVQENLVHGTRESIRDEVKTMFDNFRAWEGKYMASPCNTIMPETPVENVWTLYEAFDEFGRYDV
jgi:hypothetical protein